MDSPGNGLLIHSVNLASREKKKSVKISIFSLFAYQPTRMKAGRGYTGVSDGDDSDEFDSSSHLEGRIISYRGSHFVQMAWSLICVLMFLSGGVMILAAQRWKPSDRECAAQLSIWCMYLDNCSRPNMNTSITHYVF